MKGESLSQVLQKLKLVHLEGVLKDKGVDSVAKVCSVGWGVLFRDCAVPKMDARNIYDECNSILEGSPRSTSLGEQRQRLMKDERLSPVLQKLKLVHLERVLKGNGVDTVAKVCSVGMGVLLRDCAVSKVDARNIYDECSSILQGSPRSTTLGEQGS
eukprot:gene13009-biopygen3925